jgi:transcription initiation factor IIE alpha subunit
MPNATTSPDGTPLPRGTPVKDTRERILNQFSRHPNRTLKLGEINATREQTEWGLAMLVRSGKVERVALNGYRLVQPDAPRNGQPQKEEVPQVTAQPAPESTPVDDETKRKFNARRAIFGAMQNSSIILKTLQELAPEWLTLEQIVDLTGCRKNSLGTALWVMRRDGMVIAKSEANPNTTYHGLTRFAYALPNNPQAHLAVPKEYKSTAATRLKAVATRARTTRASIGPREAGVLAVLRAADPAWLSKAEIVARCGGLNEQQVKRAIRALRENGKVLGRRPPRVGKGGNNFEEYALKRNPEAHTASPLVYKRAPVVHASEQRIEVIASRTTGLDALAKLTEDATVADADRRRSRRGRTRSRAWRIVDENRQRALS